MPFDATKAADIKTMMQKLKKTYKNISPTAARQAIHVFNSVMDQSNDEGRAWASVYAAMNKRKLTKKATLLLKLAASLPVGDETRRALIKLAEEPPKEVTPEEKGEQKPKGKGPSKKMLQFLDEVGDQKVINPVTKNKVKVKTLSTYPKESPAYKLFWDDYQRWLKEQDKKKSEIEPDSGQRHEHTPLNSQVEDVAESAAAIHDQREQHERTLEWDSRFNPMFQDTFEIHEWARDNQKQNRKKWTDAQKAALRKYTGPQYWDINEILRGQKKERDFEYEDTIATLDTLFSSPEGKMNTEIFVRRGGGSRHPLYKMLEEGTLKEGYVFEDPGYQSSTMSKDLGWGGGVDLMIKVPKGTPAVYLGGPSSEYSNYPHEYEVLLNRGSKLKITGIRKSPDPNSMKKYLIDAEVIVE